MTKHIHKGSEMETQSEETMTEEQDTSNGAKEPETTKTSETSVAPAKEKGGRPRERVICEMEGAQGWTTLDEGPEDKGFKGKADAVDAVKEHVKKGIDEGLLDPNNLPAFRVIREVVVMLPKPKQVVEIDFGDV